jgi:hypothetical protein
MSEREYGDRAEAFLSRRRGGSNTSAALAGVSSSRGEWQLVEV